MEVMVKRKGKVSIGRLIFCLVLSLAMILSLAFQGWLQPTFAAAPPVVEVSTGAELNAAINAADSLTVISLQNDIDAITSATYAGGRQDTGKKVIIEGNGYTLLGAGPGTNTGLRFARGTNDVTVKNLVFKNLSTNLRYGGGAISVFQGKLTIEGCAFIDNSNTAAASNSLNNGGGAVLLHNGNNTLVVTNSTFFGNSTALCGGAISSRGPAIINNCTIVGNSAGAFGGGISTNTGAVLLQNSIVVGNEVLGGTISNTAYPAGPSDVKNVTDGGHNLIGTIDPVSLTDPTPSMTVDATTLIGQTRAGLRLASAPANNGVSNPAAGSGWTLAITNAASAAIGAADPTTAVRTDQRGYFRDAAPDIGAFEYVSTGINNVLPALQELIDEAAAYNAADYTTAVQAALASAIADAQAIIDLGAGAAVSDAYDAAWALVSVLAQLPNSVNARVAAKMYSALLASAEYTDIVATDYTPASSQVFADAKQAMLDIIATPLEYSTDDANDAFAALVAAKLNLVRVVDLVNLIAYANAEIATGNYVSPSVDYVTGFINTAQALLDSGNATQLQISTATANLTDALINYFFEKGDKTDLIALVAIISAQNTALYTPGSVADLNAALAAAAAAIAEPDALYGDIEDAYDALIEAASNLVLRANKADLGAAIVKANQISADSQRYIPSSLIDLNATLPGAQAVYDNADASQAAVDAQFTALNTALSKVRVIANRTKLQELVDMLSPILPTSYTPASFQPFASALNDARGVLALSDELVTEKQINDAEVALLAAYEGLVKLPADNAAAPGIVSSGNSAGLAADTSLAAVPNNPGIAAGSTPSSESSADVADIAPAPTPLTDGSIPYADADQASLLNWLTVTLGVTTLVLLAALIMALRKRQQSH